MVVFSNEMMAQLFNYACANYRSVRSVFALGSDTHGFSVPFLYHDKWLESWIYVDNAPLTRLHICAPKPLMQPVLPANFPLDATAMIDVTGRTYPVRNMADHVYFHGLDTGDDGIIDDVAHILHYLQYRAQDVVGARFDRDTDDLYDASIPVVDLCDL